MIKQTTAMIALRLWIKVGIFAIVGASSCSKQQQDVLVIPDQYDGASFTSQVDPALRNQLTLLVNEMKRGRIVDTVLLFSALQALYNPPGLPSLSKSVTPYYNSRIAAPDNGFLFIMARASGSVYSPGLPQGSGGVFGGYLFDETGLEMEQLVEKGLLSAAMFREFNQLALGNITEATVDQMVSVYGAHPDFPNSFQANIHVNPDVFSANYAARRDKNDGTGFYTRIRDQFIRLQAAVRGGTAYNIDRDAAIAEIRLLWEKSTAATIIHYVQVATSKLSNTNPTVADQAAALHALSEAIGFLHGFRTVQPKVIQDADIDNLLNLMNAPWNATSAPYLFVTNPVQELPKLDQATERIANIYGFTPAEVDAFRQNWVLVQNR
jgi:hypothetical protein